MTQTKQIVIVALFSATSAVKISYRPPEGSVPWHLPITVPDFEEVGSHPVNYFVPDFGVDSDIINATNAISQSEKVLKKNLHASFKADKPTVATPRNYFVPDFGVDHDIMATTSSISQAETSVGSTLTANFKADKSDVATPRNYVVPDFGVDHDILHTQHAIDISEKKLNHSLTATFEATKNGLNPRDYFVPDFGVDRDIKWTQGSLQQSEATLKHKWTPVKSGDYWTNMPASAADSSYVYSNSSPEDSAATKTNGSTAFVGVSKGPIPTDSSNLQLDSDPICSSAGCTQYKAPEVKTHPMDYFVPNFGMDHHILESDNSEQWASKEIGHTWIWQKEEKKDPVEYKTEPLDVDMKASLSNLREQESIHGIWDIPQDSLIDLQSDPICSSAGCTQYKAPEVKTHPMDYFVPDFGVDHDIQDSFTGLKTAEEIRGHKMGWEKTKKPADPSYTVPDFGVDEDIIRAQDGLAWAQNDLSHTWTPTQDKNGYWNVPEAASAASYSYNGESGFSDHLAGH